MSVIDTKEIAIAKSFIKRSLDSNHFQTNDEKDVTCHCLCRNDIIHSEKVERGVKCICISDQGCSKCTGFPTRLEICLYALQIVPDFAEAYYEISKISTPDMSLPNEVETFLLNKGINLPHRWDPIDFLKIGLMLHYSNEDHPSASRIRDVYSKLFTVSKPTQTFQLLNGITIRYRDLENRLQYLMQSKYLGSSFVNQHNVESVISKKQYSSYMKRLEKLKSVSHWVSDEIITACKISLMTTSTANIDETIPMYRMKLHDICITRLPNRPKFEDLIDDDIEPSDARRYIYFCLVLLEVDAPDLHGDAQKEAQLCLEQGSLPYPYFNDARQMPEKYNRAVRNMVHSDEPAMAFQVFWQQYHSLNSDCCRVSGYYI